MPSHDSMPEALLAVQLDASIICKQASLASHLHEAQPAALAWRLDPGQVHLWRVGGGCQQLEPRKGKAGTTGYAQRVSTGMWLQIHASAQNQTPSQARQSARGDELRCIGWHMDNTYLAVQVFKLLGSVGEGDDLGGAHKPAAGWLAGKT
jgi:hypothetical protein